MAADLNEKIQNARWWITSIAVSLLCCAVIFVWFSSFFVDFRNEITASFIRLNMIEDRENKILSVLENMRKLESATVTVTTPAVAPIAVAPVATPSPAIELAPPGAISNQPAPSTMTAPAPPPPVQAPSSASPSAETGSSSEPPSITVPVITPPPPPAPSDKK